MFLLSVVLALIVLLFKPLSLWFNQPIATVKVEGALTHVTPKTIKNMMLPYLSQPLFSINLRAMHHILLSDAWIYRAHIQRKWPNIVQLHLTEETPLAVWNKKAFINSDGTPFYPKQLETEASLPDFSGPEGSEKRMITMYRFLTLQLKMLGLSVNALRLTDRNTWSFYIKAVSVKLGADSANKISRFKKLYQTVLISRWPDVQSVDLRYHNGVAVGWKSTERREVLR